MSGSDVYFGPWLHLAAPAPSRYKASLHASGKCHWAFDQGWFEEVGAKKLSRKKRHTVEWMRPPTPAEGGSVHVFSILVMPDDPEGTPRPPADEIFDMTMRPPAVGQAVELQIVYSFVPRERIKIEGGDILGFHLLASGETVYFIGRLTDFDPTVLRPASQNGVGTWLGEPGEAMPMHIRAALLCDPPLNSHVRTSVDVAVRMSPDKERHFDIVIPAQDARRDGRADNPPPS